MLCDNIMVGKRHFAGVKNPQNDTTERVDPEYKVWTLIIMCCFITCNKCITQVSDVNNMGNGGEGVWYIALYFLLNF